MTRYLRRAGPRRVREAMRLWSELARARPRGDEQQHDDRSTMLAGEGHAPRGKARGGAKLG